VCFVQGHAKEPFVKAEVINSQQGRKLITVRGLELAGAIHETERFSWRPDRRLVRVPGTRAASHFTPSPVFEFLAVMRSNALAALLRVDDLRKEARLRGDAGQHPV